MVLASYLRKNIFAPPYPLLPLAVWAYFVICFILHPLSPIHTGQFADPDDIMRLNEVINWLSGQSWYDLGHARLSPGSHTVVHWSRLVDLPITLFMLPLIKCCGLQKAAFIASMIVLPLLFGLLLFLVPAMARPLMGTERANLAALMLLFAPMVLFNFSPGRVDHHAYQILIAGFGLVCLERLLNDAKAECYAVLAAITFACGLWIGTEALPWLLVFITCVAFVAAWQGGYALRNAAVFGVALAAATLVILPIALPKTEFASRALSWFSMADVIFAALTGFVLMTGGILGQQTKDRRLRLGLMAALGFYAAMVFIWLVPDTLAGPFADYDSFNATTALDNINEARPLWHALWLDSGNHLTYVRALSAFIHLLILPLAALAVVAFNLRHTKRRERITWLLHGAFLLAAFLLTLFWQVRVGYFMQLFALAPLTWLLCAAWARIVVAFKGRPRYWAEVGIFMLLGPLPVILVPALFEKTSFYPDMVLFPAARTENTCPLQPAADYLDRRYHGRDITILAGMNEGPELLFRTPFKVIAANYNVAGNEDVRSFFNARDDKTARDILRKWHADIVLTCRNIAPFLAGMDHPAFGRTVFLRPGNDGKLHLTSGISSPALLEKLVNNKPPAWLKPVEIPGSSSYLLFEVATGTQSP